MAPSCRIVGLLSLFFCTSVVFCNLPLVIQDCGKPGALWRPASFTVSPYPIHFPGNVSVSGDVSVAQKVTSNNTYELRLQIQFLAGFFWLPVPCIGGVGSCPLDLCGIFSRHCPLSFPDNNLPCSCEEVEATTYSLKDVQVELPALPAVLTSLISSTDFKLTGQVFDTSTNQEIACVHIEASVVADLTN